MMRNAVIYIKGEKAGVFQEIERGARYRFIYDQEYSGEPVSLTMPVKESQFEYEKFPPFFDGLLPEGYMLDSLLKLGKIDENDLFGQLIAVGGDLVGSVTVEEA